MYDIILRGGTVIDGSGGAPTVCDIAIKDGIIAKIGENLDGAAEVLDVTGLTVTPGFVDSHSHADSCLVKAPDLIEKIEQGITTNIAGQCGGSPAPVRSSETDEIRTMGQFLNQFDGVAMGCNTMCFVGHNALRRLAMGNENRAPSAEEMEIMKKYLAEGVDAGALGVSFGLTYNPGCYADTEEMVELATVAHEHGGIIAAHIRSESYQLEEAVAEFIEVCRRSGAKGVISHHKACQRRNWGKVNKTLAMIDKAVAEGIDIYCDAYPYTACSTSLAPTFIPKEYRAGSGEEMRARLDDPEFRKMLVKHNTKLYSADCSWVLMVGCSKHPEFEGLTIPQIAKMRGTTEFDTVFDLIQMCVPTAKACFFSINDEDVCTVLSHPRSMICTDSGVAMGKASFHPRLRGSFPRVLGRYIREKRILPMEEMIRKMTSLPASVYGIPNKGLIREGYDADLCIFDAEKIIDRSDYLNCVPGCEGLNYVLTKGQIAVVDGVYTGKKGGQVILAEH